MRLQLIGPFRLGGATASPPLPKKVQGVLAYLAMHPGRDIPREHLAHLMWGDSGAAQARHSLRQCLASLRAAAGAPASDIIHADATTVRLVDSDALDVDVTHFELLARSTSAEWLNTAAELYRGEFLAGLHVASEPFAEWVAIERRRLAAVMSDVLYRLAGALGPDGEAAIAAAQRLVAFDPLREDAHRLLIRLLAGAGRRDAALKHYLACAATLRRELGIGPEPETVALAESIRRGEVARDRAGSHAADDPAPVRHRTEGEGGRTRPKEGRGACAPSDKPSLAVLPFACLGGDPDQHYLAAGIAEDITNALGREPWLRVISPRSASACTGGSLGAVAANGDLGPCYVLNGSVRRQRDSLRISVELSDAASHAHIWASRFETGHDDIFDRQDAIARQIAGTMVPRLRAAEMERVAGNPAMPDSAYSLFLRALRIHRIGPAKNKEALRLLYRAIEIDPLYAPAYGLAGRCYQLQKIFGWAPHDDAAAVAEGIRLAHLASEIGTDEPEPLWMAGCVIAYLAGEIEHGLALVEKSVALNPSSSCAWTAAGGVRVFDGDASRALACLEEARRLNPLDPLAQYGWLVEARAHFLTGDYDRALAAADKALHVQASYVPALRMRAGLCGILGRTDEGGAWVKRLLALNPDAAVAQIKDQYRLPMRRNTAALEVLLDGLRRSGLPLEAAPRYSAPVVRIKRGYA